MDDPRKAAWRPYVRAIADRLRLRDHEVEIVAEDAGGGDAAILPYAYRRGGKLCLSEEFLGMSPERQRQTVVHELLHLHYGPAYLWAESQLDGVAMEAFRRLHEIGHESLAEAVAPLLPLPSEGADRGANGRVWDLRERDAEDFRRPAHSRGPCKVCGESVRGYCWFDKDPEKYPDARPIHEGRCFAEMFHD